MSFANAAQGSEAEETESEEEKKVVEIGQEENIAKKRKIEGIEEDNIPKEREDGKQLREETIQFWKAVSARHQKKVHSHSR